MNVLKDLPLNELISVVEQYPWFSAARKELCIRTGEPGAAALYIGDRGLLFGLASENTGKQAGETLKEVLGTSEKGKKHTEVRVVGGDYFSAEDYEEVSKSVDKMPARPQADRQAAAVPQISEEDFMDICTETLAQIYAEQGHFEQAKNIYSKLILRYPEKNAYFAALIGKLGVEN